MDKIIWLTTAEAANYVGLTVQALTRYRRDGTGPSWYRVGRRSIKYRQTDLDNWLESRKVEN